MKLFRFFRSIPLVWWNLGAFIAGCLAGLMIYRIGIVYGVEVRQNIVSILSPFGGVLINMLKMIVVPIIFFSLLHGTASLPVRTFGKMGMWVCVWYFCTSLFSVIFGSTVAFIFDPKLDSAQQLAGGLLSQVEGMKTAAAGGGNAFLNIIYSLFTNPFRALADGSFLPVIVFAILLGLACRMVLDDPGDDDSCRKMQLLLDIVDALQKAVFRIIGWVMHYFPVGVFALTACNFAIYGVTLIQSYMQLALCVITGIMLMLTVCYPVFMALICQENPYPVLWKLREPVLTAFVTRSSAATLPVSLRTVQEKLHVRKELSGFTLSLGATVNMDGVCIHLPAFAILAANLFGFEMSLAQILLMVISVVFASIGAGGVPGGSVFLLFMVLGCFNMSPEQTSLVIALALGINPLLDMFETACNVAGDNIGTYVVGRKLGLIDGEPRS